MVEIKQANIAKKEISKLPIHIRIYKPFLSNRSKAMCSNADIRDKDLKESWTRTSKRYRSTILWTQQVFDQTVFWGDPDCWGWCVTGKPCYIDKLLPYINWE